MFSIVKRSVKGFIRWFKRVILRQRPQAVKPSGTTSLVFGTTSGIEPLYTTSYARRVRDPLQAGYYDAETYTSAFLQANYPSEFAACQRKENVEN